MAKAFSPFDGKVVVSQSSHTSIIAGRRVGGAIDFIQSTVMRLLGKTNSRLPDRAVITQIVKKIDGKQDGSVMFRFDDGTKGLFVHILPNPKLKVGGYYKAGTRTGVLDPKPVNANGKHWHHALMTNKNRPVNMFKYYDKLGIKNWYKDPNGLLK